MMNTVWPPWLVVVLLVLGVHRVTRLITYDQFPFIAIPRAWVTNWFDPSPTWKETHLGARAHGGFIGRTLAYLWECDWCVSIWVAGGLTWLTYEYTSVMQWILAGLTASTVTGLIAMKEDRTYE